MADREVKVALKADVTRYIAGIRAAERATSKWADGAVADAARANTALAGAVGARPGPAGPAPRAPSAPSASNDAAAAARARAEEQRLAKQAEAMDTVGTAAVAMGGAIAGGLVVSAKAAIDWESAWAGVTKTVDGTTEEMAALEGQLRGMAKTLPISHKEIAGVAEAAGQLGVKRADIASFTKTMIDLGVSTNLSAEDAATAIAQMANVMGTAPKDISRLGSALVALGNAGASTEADIMAMAQRLSGAGKLVGASEADVLAMANAMASVGIESELGGGAMSRTLMKIYTSVKQGGKELDSFAKTAGMTAQEFAAAFAADPMRAVQAFAAGLGRIKAEGGNVVGALGEVKIKGTQDLQVLLRLAGASDMLGASLDLGTQAWKENTALTNEANKRYDTVAAKLSIAKNNVVDLAIQIGDELLPVIAAMADAVSEAADTLESLPGPVRKVATALAGIGAASLLLGGALLLTLPRIQATRAALATLAGSSMWLQISTNMRLMTTSAAGAAAGLKLLGAAAAALAVLYAADKAIGKLSGTSAKVDELTVSLRTLGDTSQATGELTRLFGDDLGKLKFYLDNALDPSVGDHALEIGAAITSFGGLVGSAAGPVDKARKRFEDLDTALTSLQANGNTESAASAFDLLSRRAGDAGVSLDEVISLLPNYSLAAGIGATEAERAASGAKKMAEQIAAAGDAAATSAADMDKLLSSILGLVSGAFDAERASISVKDQIAALSQKIREATKSGKAHARSLSENTQLGRDNALAVMSIVDAEAKWITTQIDATTTQDEVTATVRRGKKSLQDQLEAMGLNTEQIRRYISELDLIPEQTMTKLGVETAAAETALSRVQSLIDNLHGKNIPITFSASGSLRSPGGGTYTVGGRTMADGGIVRGPGGPRDDKIPAWLSHGEYVVKAAATSRHRPLLEHINAGRYAAGGPAGNPWTAGLSAYWFNDLPTTAKGTQKALDDLGKRLDKVNDTLRADKLGQARKDAREMASAIKAAFVQGADITALPNAGGSSGQLLSDLQGKLDRAHAFTGAVDQLRRGGLNKTALDQIVAGGAEGGGLAAATQLLNDMGAIRRVNDLMGHIAGEGAKLGAREAKAKYAETIRKAEIERKNDLAERRRLLARKAELTRLQRELEKTGEAEKDTHVKATAKAVAKRVTGTGNTLSAVSSGGSLAPLHVKVTFDTTGTDKHLKAWIRQIVRVDGGGIVQKAFGS